MSIASKLLTLNGLYQRIQTKLRSLGLMYVSDTGLSDCTDAIEDIDEVTPYMMTQAGIQNVAGYKYAQIDQTAWVPAGSTPSGLVSVVTGLSAAGIVEGHPRNPVVVGTVYPPSGYQGIYANQIELDGDVIKAENIKSGVSILGVNGSLALDLVYGDASAGTPSSVTDTLVVSNVPFTSINQLAYVCATIYTGPSSGLLSIVAFATDDGLSYVAHIKGDDVVVNSGFSFAVSNGNLTITNTYPAQGNMFTGQFHIQYGYWPNGNLWGN